MADTPATNLTGLKGTLGSNNAVYVTMKPQYTGSWRDDINALSKLTAIDPAEIIKQNPWLTGNNFTANDRDYVTLKLKAGSTGGSNTSGNTVNNIPSGYYSTNTWTFPLGVGTWQCTTGYSSEHTGLDFTTGIPRQIEGYPIYAAKAGTIVSITSNKAGSTWGNSILIRHDDTKDSSGNCYYTRYAHMLQEVSQNTGDKVSQGDKIGNVGNTGKSTGPHLHFQIYWTSATRTDYGNFSGHADFSINPNNISDFPGIPWEEGKKSAVDYQKSEYVTDKDIEVIKKAVEDPEEGVTQSEWDETINGIAERIIKAKNIDSSSQIAQIVREYIERQLEGLKQNGLTTALDMVKSGQFFETLENTVTNVVNQTIWYMYNRVGEQITTAAEEQVNEAKTGLKNWVLDAINVDPNSETGQTLGNYLDSYVDTVIATGWQAVTTAISTGDVEQAFEGFVENTKNAGIDFTINVTTHGTATAITNYLKENIQDSEASQVAVDLAIGLINVIGQSIGGVLKGEISIEQAAKNVLNKAAQMTIKYVFRDYLAPKLASWLSGLLSSKIIELLTAAGFTVGNALGAAIGFAVGAVVSLVVQELVNWIADKVTGLFTQ